jgi:membrane protein implicated in regulation of membrane protease activity
MSWLTDHPALAWLGLALVLAAIEAATVDFLFLMLAGGALAASLTALLGQAFVVQVVVGVAVALVLVGAVRPIVVRRVHSGPSMLTGTAALVGREGRVVETVSEVGGRIKLSGEVWSARVAGPSTALVLPGQIVRVVAIEGATAVVQAAGPEPESS